MTKFIDAEKLKRFVGELKKQAKRNCCDSWGIVPDALEEVEGFIDSLQQEQPEGGYSEKPNDLLSEQDVDLKKAARNVYESWMGGTMNDVRRDMIELGKVLNARK